MNRKIQYIASILCLITFILLFLDAAKIRFDAAYIESIQFSWHGNTVVLVKGTKAYDKIIDMFSNSKYRLKGLKYGKGSEYLFQIKYSNRDSYDLFSINYNSELVKGKLCYKIVLDNFDYDYLTGLIPKRKIGE